MYRALPSHVTIKESKIHGLGLFAKEDIPKNTLLGLTHIKHELFQDNYIRTPIGGYYNHSDDPNCYSLLTDELLEKYVGTIIGNFGLNENENKDKFRYLISLKDIKKGEEITSKYKLYKIK